MCYKGVPVKDLTAHSIGKHILQMALPIAAGMLFQTLYFLIDLYFVAHLGDAAIAGVSALWLLRQPEYRLVELWYVSIASMAVQAVASLWLVRGQLRRRMPDAAAALQAG